MPVQARRVTGPLSISAAVDNLFDAVYMDPLGYPALGACGQGRSEGGILIPCQDWPLRTQLTPEG